MKYRSVFTVMILILVLSYSCNRNGEKRKIKLSEDQVITQNNQQLSTTIYLEPRERRSIAVMFFQNLTGDDNLQWLQKGISEMLIRALSQSQNLSVLSTDRLFEILDRLDHDSTNNEHFSLEIAAIVAREAKAEAVLTGEITKNGDSLKINVKMIEPTQGLLMNEESVEGQGLESIFSMVDHLTQKIKGDLQFSFDKGAPEKGIADMSTHSLEAWRYFTAGVDLLNKLLYVEARVPFEKAIALDPQFVSAYLHLFHINLALDNRAECRVILQKVKTLTNKASRKEVKEIAFYDAVVRKDLHAMVEQGEAWIKEFPDDKDALMTLGYLYFVFNNYRQALSHYEKIHQLDPNDKLALNQMIYCQAYLGNFSNAIDLLKKYQTIAPDEPNPYDSMGEIYFFTGDYDRARKQFQHALALNENFISSLRYLGNICMDRGEDAQALRFYQTLLDKVSVDQRALIAYSDIANTYKRMNETDKAIENYRNYLTRSGQRLFSSIESLYELESERRDSTAARQSIDEIYQLLKAETITPENILLQSLISLHYDVRVQETIETIQRAIREADSDFTRSRLTFMLTLLSLKSDQWDQRRKTVDNHQMMSFLTEFRLFGYSGIWKYYLPINRYFYTSMDEGIRQYRELIDLSVANGQKVLEMPFRMLLSDLYDHAGEIDLSAHERQIVGAPEESFWRIIGPFENRDGFNRKYPPEQKIDVNKNYSSANQRLRWLGHSDEIKDGYINLRSSLPESEWSVAYALIDLNSPDDRRVQFRVGSNESVKIWLNGRQVWKLNINRDAIFDHDVVDVDLHRGINRILVKICNRIGDWGFYFRVTDSAGNGMPDLRFIPAGA